MTALSPGVANSCLELLDLVGRRTLSFDEIKGSFPQIGVVSTARAIEVAQYLQWLAVTGDGHATLTPSGSRLMAPEDPETRLRQAILDYIDIEEPFWIQNAAFGRKRVLAFAGTPIAQLFLEAGLVDGISRDVVAFWDALAARARGQKDDRLLSIGREGERLTVAYEYNRTGKHPKWVAIDSSEDGYDVLSVVDTAMSQALSIEVKTTRMGMHGSFHVTRNEWERAQTAAAHVFHLWDTSGQSPKLAVIALADLVPHIPTNQGCGEWELTGIPFEAFASRFNVRHELAAKITA